MHALTLLLCAVLVWHAGLSVVAAKVKDHATAMLAHMTFSFCCLGLLGADVVSAIAENSYEGHSIMAFVWLGLGVSNLILARSQAAKA